MGNKTIDDLVQITTIATGDKMLITDIDAPVDEKSKHVTLQQLDDRFGATVGATPAGEMGIVDNTTPVEIDTINVWVKATGFTADNLQFVTFLDDTLIIQVPAKYLLNGSLSGERSTVGTDDFEVAVFLNGTLVPKTKNTRNFSNAPGYVGTTAILDLAKDDELEVYFRNTTGTADFTPITALLNIHGL